MYSSSLEVEIFREGDPADTIQGGHLVKECPFDDIETRVTLKRKNKIYDDIFNLMPTKSIPQPAGPPCTPFKP